MRAYMVYKITLYYTYTCNWTKCNSYSTKHGSYGNFESKNSILHHYLLWLCFAPIYNNMLQTHIGYNVSSMWYYLVQFGVGFWVPSRPRCYQTTLIFVKNKLWVEVSLGHVEISSLRLFNTWLGRSHYFSLPKNALKMITSWRITLILTFELHRSHFPFDGLQAPAPFQYTDECEVWA